MIVIIKKIKQHYLADTNMFNNIIGTSVIKAVSLVLNIYSINAYLNFFSGDSIIYGTWLTITSVFNWVLMFDLGMGNGLRNNLVIAIGNEDKEEQKKLISSAYILLGLISGIIFMISIFSFDFIAWDSIFNIQNNYISNQTINLVVKITLFGILCHFVLKLFVSILYAFKYTTFASSTLLLTNLIMFVYASFFTNPNPDGAIMEIAIVYAISLIFPILLLSLILFKTVFSEIRPSFKYYDNSLAIRVLSLGGQFFLIQIFLLVINSTNEIIIINIDNPQAVVLYNMYFRIFSAIIAFGSVINNPIWSSISESYATKDFQGIIWRKKIVNRIAILLSILSFIIALFYKPIANIIFNVAIKDISTYHAILFAVYTSISLFINSVSTVSNGISELSPQILGTFLAALLKIPVVYVIYQFIPSWLSLIYTNIFILLISLVVQYFGLKKRLSKETLN